MTSDVITPGDEQRDELVALMRVAFNLGSGSAAERAAWLPMEKMRCVLDGDRIVAAAGARAFRQWWGGRELDMSGIWGVVTLPEHRGGGLATRAVTELLVEARSAGVPLSVLYPATQRPYRGMGYELAGTMTRHAIALDDLPRGSAGPLAVEEYDADRDLEDVRACYRASVSGHQGPIDSDEPDWWPDRVLGRWFSDDVQRTVVARGRSGVEGYASFTFGSDPGGPFDFEYAINCRHLVATSVEGWASLLSYLRGFRGSRSYVAVHRSAGASVGAAGRGATAAAGVVVPVDAAAAGRAGGALGAWVPAGVGLGGAVRGGRAVPGQPWAVAGGGGRFGLGECGAGSW